MAYRITFSHHVSTDRGQVHKEPVGIVTIEGEADEAAAVEAAIRAFEIAKRVAHWDHLAHDYEVESIPPTLPRKPSGSA